MKAQESAFNQKKARDCETAIFAKVRFQLCKLTIDNLHNNVAVPGTLNVQFSQQMLQMISKYLAR